MKLRVLLSLYDLAFIICYTNISFSIIFQSFCGGGGGGGGIAQSVHRLTTGWTVGGSNTDGDDIFRNRPNRPWTPPVLLYNE